MSGNRYNFETLGKSYSHFNNDIDTSNLVDGKPIYYLVGASGTVVDSSSNAGIVYCINCDSGICFVYSCNNIIPQVHHTPALPTANGWINCTKFIDANEWVYYDWIPAIRLE